MDLPGAFTKMGYNPLASGTSFKGPSRQLGTNYQNGTVSTMAPGTPVAVNSSSQLILIDIADETTVENMVGYVVSAIPSSATGQIISGGRLENISSSYPAGTPVWIGTTPGTLTNVKPDLSQSGWVSGMFIIFVGVVVANEFNPSLTDIQLFTQIIGQL